MTPTNLSDEATAPQLLELLDNDDAFRREREHSPLARALDVEAAAKQLRALADERRSSGLPAVDLRRLNTLAGEVDEAAEALAREMEQSWRVADALVDHAPIADLIGERHRIIANDWQSAGLQLLAVRLVRRAIDLTTHAASVSRRDAPAAASAYLQSAAELLDRAADLLAESAALMHDNAHRRRVFGARVAEVLADIT